MYHYRISKYNPLFKDEFGRYLKDEWTSESDIGKTYNGKLFTKEEYLETESHYIQAIFLFMEMHNINYLNLKDIEFAGYDYFLEKFNNNRLEYTDDLLNMCKEAKTLKTLSFNQTESFCKLALREHIWGILYSQRKLKIDFGYDYYLHISSSISIKEIINKIQELGLFVEER